MSETPIDFHPEQIDRFERFTELAGLLKRFTHLQQEYA